MGLLNFSIFVLFLVHSVTKLKGCVLYWPMVSYHIADLPGKDSIRVYNPTDNDIFEVSDEIVLYSGGIKAIFLKFTGERRRYVETNVLPNKEYDKQFSISMFYRSSLSNGTLFHYRANSPSTKINEVKIKLENGVIKSSIMCSGVVCSKTITENTDGLWNFVSFDYYMGEEKVQLNGIARIGGSLDNPVGEFVGVFQCVAMLPKPADSDITKWNDGCKYEDVNKDLYNGEITRRPLTEILVTSIWPLNNRSCGYEAVNVVKPNETPTGLCSKWTTSQPPLIVGLEESSVVTFSKDTEYIKTTINDNWSFDRFSIAMFVQVSKVKGNSAILHVRFPNGYFESLTVKIDKNDNIIILLSGVEKITQHINGTDSWHFIAVQYNRDWDELSLIIDDMFYETSVTQTSSTFSTSPGVQIEIGGFEGNIACVAIFNTPLSENTASGVLKQKCQEITFTAPAENAPQPVMLWPLSKWTMGFEMVSGQLFSTTPTKLCWRFNQNEPSNLLDSEAVQFYGADQFSLAVGPINTSDIFVLGLFVETQGTNGTILKLNFATQSVELSMNIGNINLKVNDFICLDVPWLFDDKWASVVLELSVNGLILNVEDTNIPHNCSTITPSLPDTMSLKLGGIPDSFIGKMRCLEIFNASIIETGSSTSILKSECSKSKDFTPDLDQAPSAPELNVWRLDDRTISTGKQIHDMELLNSNQSLYFDGSSRLHLLINVSIPTDDMSLGFFFRPMKYTKGVILQETSSDFRVSIDDHRLVINTKSSCDTITFTGVTDGDWHWLMINRIISCKSLVFVLDGEVKYDHSNCFGRSGLMEVRLGGEERSFNNFRGDLSCLTLYSSSVDWDVGNDSMKQLCNSNISDGYFNIEGDDISTNSKFYIIATNSFPSGQDGMISQFYVKSSLDCSKTCIQTKYCRSYSLNATEAFTTCTLFDFVTLGGFTILEGSKYYGILY